MGQTGVNPQTRTPDAAWREKNKVLASELTSAGIGVNSSILNAMIAVPRGRFISDSFADIAYEDISVPGFDGGLLPSPSDTLRIIEMLNPSAGDTILVAGNNAGYAAAILSRIAGQIYLIEETSAGEKYRKIFEETGFTNISVADTSDINAYNNIIAFNRILIHGAASEISERITERLTIQGSVTFILAEQGGFQQIITLRRSLLGDNISTGGSCYFSVIRKLKISN